MDNEINTDANNLEDNSEFNVENASDKLASDLFQKTDVDPDDSLENDEPPEVIKENTEKVPTEVRAAPKTWPKEMHDHWAKTPVEVQNYWETREKQMLDGLEQYKGDAGFGKQIRDVITPYNAMLQSQGVDGAQAVQTLLNAHYKLTTASPSEKAAYFNTLAQHYGIDFNGALKNAEPAQKIDPIITQLRDELHNIKQHISSGEQQAMNMTRERISQDVSAFAADTTHPYFDEVADDIIIMLKSGATLENAYEKAVWANPVTRAKEISRLQQEQQESFRRTSLEKAEAAKKAKGPNLQIRDTRRTPTEKNGATMRNLDDALRETMREIKERTH